ncbi:MAG: DUF3137 domain-containing protein [Aureispira sp.]
MYNLAELSKRKQFGMDSVKAYHLQEQQVLRRGQYWFLLPIFLMILTLSLFVFHKFYLAIVLCSFSLLVFILVGALKIIPVYNRFNDQFKQRMLRAFLEDLYPSIYYAPANYIPSSLFEQAQLYPTHYSYVGKDYVEAKMVKGSSFKFSALSVHAKTSQSDTIYAAFKGLFLVVKTRESCHSPIYILPSSSTFHHPKVEAFDKQTLESVLREDMYDSRLEKYAQLCKKFTVYSQSEIAIKSILKTTLLETIHYWTTQWQSAIRVSWIGQQLFVALPMATVFPVIELKDENFKEAELVRFYDQLLSILSVVECY